MATTVVDVLDLLRAAIEAVVPHDQVNEDDVFRTFTLGAPVRRSSRAMLVTATPPIRSMPGLTCYDWQTTITLSTLYAIGQAEEDQRTAYERALLDSENIAEAIYTWVASGAVLHATLQEGDISPDNDGALVCERQLVLQWTRGP